MATNILLGKHHDITAFASKDANRYAIQSVHYHHDKKLVEATDGRVMIRVPVVEDKDGVFPPVSVNGEAKDCIIPIAPFKKALGNVQKSNLPICEHLRLSVSEKAGTPGLINLCTTDLDTEQNVTTRPIDAQYPNVDQVLPTEETKFSYCLSAKILKQIAEYAERNGHAANGTDIPVKFEFTEELRGVKFSVMLDTPMGIVKAEGMAMPMRMS